MTKTDKVIKKAMIYYREYSGGWWGAVVKEINVFPKCFKNSGVEYSYKGYRVDIAIIPLSYHNTIKEVNTCNYKVIRLDSGVEYLL